MNAQGQNELPTSGVITSKDEAMAVLLGDMQARLIRIEDAVTNLNRVVGQFEEAGKEVTSLFSDPNKLQEMIMGMLGGGF